MSVPRWWRLRPPAKSLEDKRVKDATIRAYMRMGPLAVVGAGCIFDLAIICALFIPSHHRVFDVLAGYLELVLALMATIGLWNKPKLSGGPLHRTRRRVPVRRGAGPR
jgi:hypothetical protein